jgi:hypothetical protein
MTAINKGERIMIRKLLMSVLLGMALITLTDGYMLKGLAAIDKQSLESPFAGRWIGEWTAKPTGTGFFADGSSEHEGTWDISIDSEGEVVGTEIDKTAADKASLKGFIDEDGYIKLTPKNIYGSNIVKGILEKRGVRLTGTLKQYCSSDRPCTIIEMTLRRK